MSKSILVVDTPESCWLCGFENEHYCGIAKRHVEDDKYDEVSEWCPLKKIPRKRIENSFPKYDTDNHYEIGWNDCVDEIMGRRNNA